MVFVGEEGYPSWLPPTMRMPGDWFKQPHEMDMLDLLDIEYSAHYVQVGSVVADINEIIVCQQMSHRRLSPAVDCLRRNDSLERGLVRLLATQRLLARPAPQGYVAGSYEELLS